MTTIHCDNRDCQYCVLGGDGKPPLFGSCSEESIVVMVLADEREGDDRPPVPVCQNRVELVRREVADE